MLLKKIKILLFFITCIFFQTECMENSLLNVMTVLPRFPLKIEWKEDGPHVSNSDKFQEFWKLLNNYRKSTASFREKFGLPIRKVSQSNSFSSNHDDEIYSNKKIISPLIVNGLNATTGQFPYQVALIFTNTTISNEPGVFCGGSLIAMNCVLTAAHCCVKKTGNVTVRVIAGAEDLSKTSPCRKELTTTTFISHPKYNAKNLNNDICCIFLKTPFNKSECIAPICVSNGNFTYENATARVSGYGKTAGNASSISYQLMYTNMTVISNSLCSKVYGTQIVPSTVLCCNNTKDPNTNKTSTTCNGDSGGPLVYYPNLSNEPCQIGIVSFGPANPVCGPGIPSGFSRLSNYTNWLQSIKANFTMCSCIHQLTIRRKWKKN